MRIKRFLISALILSLLILPQANTYSASLNTVLKKCDFSESSKSYINFLSSVLDYQRIFQIFDDIIYRNSCQESDIYYILDLSEKSREQLRKAFYSCDSEGIQDKMKSFTKYDMELDYLRSFVDNASVEGVILEVPKEKLMPKMLDYYVTQKASLTNEEFTQYFNEFEGKYRKKVADYLNCEDPVWKELIQKIEQFGETLGGFNDPIFADLTKDFEETMTVEDFKPVTLDSFSTQMVDFLTSKLAVNVNGVDALKGIDQIAAEYTKYAPSFDEFANKQVEEQARYVREVNTADMLGRYKTMYFEGSDTLVTRFNTKMEDLLKIIDETFPIMQNVSKCEQSVADKECK